MTNSKSPTSSNCFSTILQCLICSNNLLTHTYTHPSPSPPHPLLQNLHYHHHSSAIVAPNYQAQCQAQITQETNTNPGIIARLMGLDSLPNLHQQNHDSLCRSKSLNSLRFLPDFDPARVAFQRGARTSSSFHENEIGHKIFPKIDEDSDLDGRITKEREVGGEELKGLRKQRSEKVVALKGNEVGMGRRRSGKNGEGRDRRREKSNGGKYEWEKRELIVNKKKEKKGRIDVLSKIKKPNNNVELRQSEALSRSPVSVLDHRHPHPRRHHKFISPPKGDSRRKWSHKTLKKLDEKTSQDHKKLKYQKKNGNQLMMKEEIQVMMEVELFGKVFLGQICKSNNKWIKKFQVFKVGFLQDLGKEFSHEILDFLINELMYEFIVS